MIRQIPILMSAPMVAATLDGTKTMTRRVRGLKNINRKATEIVRSDQWKKTGDWVARFLIPGEVDKYEVTNIIKCPYGQIGDRLYVRENFKMSDWDFDDGSVTLEYADGEKETFYDDDGNDEDMIVWADRQVHKLAAKGVLNHIPDEERMEWTGKINPFIPSIHLPKWGSRLWLCVLDIKVERLQDISKEDCIDEGINEYQPENRNFRVAENYFTGGTISDTFEDYCQQSFRSLWRKINDEGSWEENPWVWVVKFKEVDSPLIKNP